MKRLRYVDVTMALTSSGVVIRGIPGGGLSFLLPDCRTDDKLFVDYIQNDVTRQQHVYLLQGVQTWYFSNLIDSLDGDLGLLTLIFLQIIAIGTTLFQYQTAYEKYPFWFTAAHAYRVF